jgi:hypothetical protein
MIEPFFGSGSPMWTGIPNAGYGWVQPPTSAGNRITSAAASGFAAPPFISPVAVPQSFAPQSFAPQNFAPQSFAPQSFAPQSFGGGMPPSGLQADVLGYGAFGVPGVIPALAGPEVANGPTARALLGAIAIRRGQPMGPTNEQEIEEFIYDAFEMLGANDVEVRLEGGRTTLTGSVPHKRLKRDAGEIAWAMPGVSDVQNNVTIVGRRRPRAGVRESESQPASARKTA